MDKFPQSIVLFDGECNFCNSTVLYIIKHDKKDKISFASQQSEIGIKLMKEVGFQNNNLDTIVLIENEMAFIKTDALIKICKSLLGLPRLFIVLKIIPRSFRDYFYEIFSKHRYNLFGKKTKCIIPTQKIKDKFLS
jgi:predicted DCC family thiol-disulfide oxidoreductase YuxK